MKFFKISFLFLVLNFLYLGCGVKGYPKPPKTFNISGIKEIHIKQMGGFAVLYWKYNKVYEDGTPLKEKINFYLIFEKEKYKINPYNKDDLYWIIEPIKDFEKKLCFKVEIETEKTYKKKKSNFVCIEPVKNYPLLTTKFDVKVKENGIYLNWEKPFPKINIYREINSSLIPPIPYKTVENKSDFLDEKVQLRKKYCYFITISENNVESNSSKIICKRFVDKFPPLPPKEGNILLEDGKLVIVWEESHSKDVIGYLIYKNGKPITEIPIKSYYFIDNTYKKGNTYEIVAVDKAGNRSEPLKIEVKF
jgi:hypothetical protein